MQWLLFKSYMDYMPTYYDSMSLSLLLRLLLLFLTFSSVLMLVLLLVSFIVVIGGSPDSGWGMNLVVVGAEYQGCIHAKTCRMVMLVVA